MAFTPQQIHNVHDPLELNRERGRSVIPRSHHPYRTALSLLAAATALVVWSGDAQASCSTTGTFTFSYCGNDYILYKPGNGTTTLTVDDETSGWVAVEPDGSSAGPYDITVDLDGTTTLNRNDYSAFILYSEHDGVSATVNIGEDVNITSVGNYGAVWLRAVPTGTPTSVGMLTVNNAGKISASGGDDGEAPGITVTHNYGGVAITNSGSVTSAGGRGLYGDGGYATPNAVDVILTNTDSGTVNGYQAAIRAINYNGFATILNDGTVDSTTRQGLVAWSAGGGGARITNTGNVTSHDDNAIVGSADTGDVYVTNSGKVVAHDDDAILVSRLGFSGIYAYADVAGSINVTNTQDGTIEAEDDYGMFGITPDGNITLTNGGKITGLSGLGADAADGTVNIINSGTVTTAGLDKATIAVLNAKGGRIENNGTLRSASAGVSNAGRLDEVVNVTGLIYSGVGKSAIENSGTISKLVNLQGGHTDAGELTYSGALPDKYVAVFDGANYGQVSFSGTTGSTSFLISEGTKETGAPVSVLSQSEYRDVMVGLSSGQLGNEMEGGAAVGVHGGDIWALTDATWRGGSVTSWDLRVFDPASELVGQQQALLQNGDTAIRNTFQFDCSVFDEHGLCVSLSGQTASYGGDADEEWSGLAAAALRLNTNLHVGGFLQVGNGPDLPNAEYDGALTTFGGFAVYSSTPGGTGLQARAAASMQLGSVKLSRKNIAGLAQTASGTADADAYGISIESGWGFDIDNRAVLRPFVGLNYVNSSRGEYSDKGDGVAVAFSYDDYSLQRTGLVAGAELKGSISDNLQARLAGAYEYYLNSDFSEFDASSNLISYSARSADSSPSASATASLGLTYAVSEAAVITGDVTLRKYEGEDLTATAYTGFQMGF